MWAGKPPTHHYKDKLDRRFEDSIKEEGDVTLLLAFDLWAAGNSITSGPRDGKSIWSKFNIGGTRMQILYKNRMPICIPAIGSVIIVC